MSNIVQIALDGPAGAGKSSVAKAVAKKMNFHYLDTGKMYRGLAYFILHNHLDISNDEKIDSMLKSITLDIQKDSIFINGEDITNFVRSPEVTKFVSTVAAKKSIREFLVAKQQEIARTKNIVMDGRDIGTVVLPQATFKFYLDASLEERARRRLRDMNLDETHLRRMKEEILMRDEKDKNRPINPLSQADDAIYIDTSNLTFDEVVGKIINIVKKNKTEI